MEWKDFIKRYSYLKPVSIAVLLYLFSNNGEAQGFRELVYTLGSNIQSVKNALLHLEYNRLIVINRGRNNTMLIKLTEKGYRVAQHIFKAIEELEEG